jgi:integron integrase
MAAESRGFPVASERPRLLDQVRNAIRRLHYSRRTEETYIHWIKRFIYFHGKRHPDLLGEPEVTAFLNHLAAERNVAAATQNQALSALLFMYREALGRELAWLDGLVRAKRPVRVPVVLTRDEVERLLGALQGVHWLMASLLYGAGLRLLECLRLRVKDVDFGYRQVLVRDGKGQKDRVTMLPERVTEPLRAHLERVRLLHQRDLREGFGDVHLPYALTRKYPRAGREWAWQYVFPSKNRSLDPQDGVIRRHHLDESVLQRAVKDAVRLAGIAKHAHCHIYTHVLNKGGQGVKSPLDRIEQPHADYRVTA